jgi:GGDEF domain-containing protein
MLRMVAHALELAVWRTDHVGRWSDDQFLVILKGSSGDSLRAVGNTAESMLARARPNLQTISNQETDPTKSAEGAASGS